MSVARTVLGDVPAADLGPTYAHEHLVIDGGRPVEMHPDFLLADVDRLAAELEEARALGLATVVDAMPADAGRNAGLLAELSRRSGVNVIAVTGLHHARYYGPSHWSERLSVDELAALFVADLEEGVDANDYSGPVVRRTPFRAGAIKVAGSEGGLSARDRRLFEAAAAAHLRTGAPILTHCEDGTGGVEQLAALAGFGVAPAAVILSHVDKVVDLGYHAELAGAGATLEYDQSFRWGDRENGTVTLLVAMIARGLGDRIVLGNDAARQRYYRAWGGGPGLVWLLGEFSARMVDAGIGEEARHDLFVTNPARAFAFASADAAVTAGTGSER
ncbi:MAG TPA: hypothetical protein VFS32_02580 [Candidatus Limnocylindrales bacterium]|nr:hypothetical protein [Candidatus Limnocylindrales bacterium]